ncbi:hypothetical protein G4Y79_23685 [Phototrophicus methaneseepsis]|uniref:Uncharacterized protein n=1 Tax=Phototrophicus methaneseepsis TaxID=2710758 RepID=A0A7S8E967_9CHLR|nr:hypothetical protein [Phototrophicus methaneseepsis]QPC82652.1 hypothetical protein G4Y79_23685 [Phototrophicus methaneseepsis]
MLAVVIWGVLRVPDDPEIPHVQAFGWLRLLIEGATFGGAIDLLTSPSQSV